MTQTFLDLGGLIGMGILAIAGILGMLLTLLFVAGFIVDAFANLRGPKQ